jgi:hypothetical protein
MRTRAPNAAIRRMLAGALVLAAAGVCASAAAQAVTNTALQGVDDARIGTDARKALLCRTAADWMAYQTATTLRRAAEETRAVDPDGLKIYRTLRVVEELSGAAFEQAAPGEDSDAFFSEMVGRMRDYLNEGDDAQGRVARLVPACQREIRRMVTDGSISPDRFQQANREALESVSTLQKTLEDDGFRLR